MRNISSKTVCRIRILPFFPELTRKAVFVGGDNYACLTEKNKQDDVVVLSNPLCPNKRVCGFLIARGYKIFLEFCIVTKPCDAADVGIHKCVNMLEW